MLAVTSLFFFLFILIQAARNSHYQLFLGLDAPLSPFVLVSHNALVLTTASSPSNLRHVPGTAPSPTGQHTWTMLIILPRPAYVYEVLIHGAGGCKMSASTGVLPHFFFYIFYLFFCILLLTITSQELMPTRIPILLLSMESQYPTPANQLFLHCHLLLSTRTAVTFYLPTLTVRLE